MFFLLVSGLDVKADLCGLSWYFEVFIVLNGIASKFNPVKFSVEWDVKDSGKFCIM